MRGCLVMMVCGMLAGAGGVLTAVGCSRMGGDDGGVARVAPPDDAWFQTEVVNSSQPVLVDFTATWCGPCQALKPSIEKLADQYHGKLKVVAIDVDEKSDLATHYSVRAMPTLAIFSKGQVVASTVGGRSYSALESWVKQHLN